MRHIEYEVSRQVQVFGICGASYIRPYFSGAQYDERILVRVLVTGVNGFVGQWLSRDLAAHRENGESLEVIGLGRKRPKSSDMVFFDRFVEADLGDEAVLLTPLLDGIDIVIHLASRVHVMRDRAADPLESYRRVNRDGSRRLADAAARAGVRRFIFMSSIKVNGERTTSIPYTEEDEPNPADPYGVSKLEAEKEIQQAAKGSKMCVVIFRPPLVYGPRVRANFRSLLTVVRKRIPLPLGSICNRRHFIFVGNLCDAVLKVVFGNNVKPGVYIVSDRESVATPELVRMVAHFLNGESPRMFGFPVGILRAGANLCGLAPQVSRLTDSLEVDCSRFVKEFGWVPPFSTSEGIKLTCDDLLRNSP